MAALGIGVSLCCSATVGLAQTCVGDCDGNGRPTIDELIRGVNIVLGSAAFELCMSLDTSGNHNVEVNELVRAVADVLYGCGVTPPTPLPTFSPSPTPIPTDTAPPTLTPTPTMGVPDAAGMWREDEYQLGSSTCPDVVDTAIAGQLAQQQPCTYTVTQNGTQVTAVDCNGTSVSGEIDAAGVVHFDLGSTSATQNGCRVSLDVEAMVDLSRSPTTLRQAAQVSFSGTCPLPPCMLEIDSRFTKL